MSDHSFEKERMSHRKEHLYLTTNLVTGLNITLADVVAEEVSRNEILNRIAIQQARSRFRENPYGRVDPRAEYKAKLSRGPVYTLVPYEEMQRLCDIAVEYCQRNMVEVGTA